MKKNLCGNCGVCCKHFRIDKKYLSWRKTTKEKGEMCDKYANNRCARYSRRPRPCKNFQCLWLKLSKEDEAGLEWRPDAVGFLIKIGKADGKNAIMIEETEKGSLDFDKITPEQDEFLTLSVELAKNSNHILLIRPFDHDYQYPLVHIHSKENIIDERKINGI